MVSAMQGAKPEQVRRRSPTRGRSTPLKLVVVACDAADAVAAAGGVIFDSVRAGWTVDLYLEKIGDKRALKILGVGSAMIPTGFEFESEWPDAVLLAAALHERHRGAQRLVTGCIRRQHTDVAFWGQDVPSVFHDDTNMEHRLSTAARAFKPYALDAAGLPQCSTLIEAFRGSRRRTDGATQPR